MCSSGQCLLLPRAKLQQMDEVSTFFILICVAATFVLNGQIGYIYFLLGIVDLYVTKKNR
ncbi:hypothetical protein [Bacillus manliponensis]|uniref:hypothetical protein n=1 Tax=Bacillus manliponensis TaxID=574376 RepID=UPI0035110A74